jgi:hypothetical protein
MAVPISKTVLLPNYAVAMLADRCSAKSDNILRQVTLQAVHRQNAAIVGAMAKHQHKLFGLFFIGEGKDGVPTLVSADSRKASEPIASQNTHLGCKYGIHED